MADGGDEAAARVSSPEHLEEYHRLIELGLDKRVARKLEKIYRTGNSQSKVCDSIFTPFSCVQVNWFTVSLMTKP